MAEATFVIAEVNLMPVGFGKSHRENLVGAHSRNPLEAFALVVLQHVMHEFMQSILMPRF